MVQNHHRIWSLLLALVMLGSCVLSPLPARASATTLDTEITADTRTTEGENPPTTETTVATEATTEVTTEATEETTEATTEATEGTTEATESTTEATDPTDVSVISDDETESDFEPHVYRWEPSETDDALVSVTGENLSQNALTKVYGTISGSNLTGVRLSLAEPLELRPDRSWSIEWCANGDFAKGNLLFSTADTAGTSGNIYLYRYSSYIAIGTYTTTFANYGVGLSNDYNTAQERTFRLVNQVNSDGTNMVSLFIDGQEIGQLNHSNGNSATISNWISGKTFQFQYIGADGGNSNGFRVTGKGLKYILVDEGVEHVHVEETIPGTAPTTFESGMTDGKRCSLCGEILAAQEVIPSLWDTTLRSALTGKKLSILGDSISTYEGVSNSTEINSTLGSNVKYYPSGDVTSVEATWWKQAADRYGMEILVNNSWSGSTVVTYSGKDAASYGWGDRTGNLHDNTLDNNADGAVINPDIIAIYMGANDLSFNKACDPAALTEEFYAKIEAGDYAPESVEDLTEAAALMVYKVRRNYPNAAIFLFNNPTLKNGNAYRDAYNQVLAALAEKYGCTLVDLYGSDLSNYSTYTADGIHPNMAGMDIMTDVFAKALYAKYVEHEHNLESIPGVEPTYTTTGLTEGKKCTLCGSITKEQELIPVLPFTPQMFRWELNAENNALVSVTNDTQTYLAANALTGKEGSINNGTFTNVRLSLEDSLVLLYNRPWSIEWRANSNFAQGKLLFSAEEAPVSDGNLFLYRHNNFISFGTYAGGYANYGVALTADYNTTQVRTFRLENRIAEDGANMVYLYVDRQLVGPLNQSGGNGATISNWISGKNFQFRHIGAEGGFQINGSGLQYIQVDEGGTHEHQIVTVDAVPPTDTQSGTAEYRYCAICGHIEKPLEVVHLAPRKFRWETQNTALENLTTGGYSANTLTQTAGTISESGTYAGTRFALEKPVILRHDRAWSIQWESSGNWHDAQDGGLLFSAADTSGAAGNRYLYRRYNSEFIALGAYEGGKYNNYGVSIAGIDTDTKHTFRLANRINADGTNMVYLYVDNQEIGPLNTQYEGGTNLNKTNNWVSGKDFQFSYIGTENHPVGSCQLDYIQVDEGISCGHEEITILPGVEVTENTAGLTQGKVCALCGEVLTAQQVIPAKRDAKLQGILMGKKLSVLGDSISTFRGVSNSTSVNDTLGSNHVYYPDNGNVKSVNDTWWKQAADRFGMSVLVNNSWSGSSVTSVRTSYGGAPSYGWNTRPENLHDNTGDIVNPDVIAIYMGTNDLMENVTCGAATLDEAFFARIEAEGFAPAATTNFEESAALMVYKVRKNYPDADIFLFNNPIMRTGTEENRADYNAVFAALAEQYTCTVVDLYDSAISDHAVYTSDGIHPNPAGMDVMTEAFAEALYTRYVTNAADKDSVATEKGVYLSDLNYIPSGSNGAYKKDTSPGGGKIQLRVDGSLVSYDKGIGAHAPSTFTFNITQYNQEYSRFTAKLGVDASQGRRGSVIFKIMGSNVLTAYDDSTGWTELLVTENLTAASAAVSVDLDVSGYNYLRLYADQNGGNGNDHSVYADARLVKAGYENESEYYPRLHSVKWYNEQLSQHTYSHNLENNQRLILEREFVSRMGIAAIQSSVKNTPDMAKTLDWLLDDADALQLFIETGNINNAVSTLNTLHTLYTQYQGIIGSEGDAYVYKKMVIALAITWANDRVLTPYGFGGGIFGSSSWYFDVVERFEAAKWVFDEGYKIYDKGMYNTYNMELMRMLMCDYMSKDEVQWVQYYGAYKYPDTPGARTGPYRFMAYVHPPVYSHEKYFTEDTWTAYDEKYNLTEYNILRSDVNNKVFRVWMVYESGGICWNISRIGQMLNKSYGIPSVGVFQPGHEAYFTYSENEAGQGLWSIGNNVGGWQRAYNNWGGTTTRLLLNWGSGTPYSRATYNNGSYILLAQGAMNQEDAFRKSSYLNMLADVYGSTEQKLEIYNASLKALDLNLDTYLDITSLYKAQDTTTAEQWRDLALQIIDAYTYYPVPMVDLYNAIEPYLGAYTDTVDFAKHNALKAAQTATAAQSIQHSACIAVANSLLGTAASDVLATFSFDGDSAGFLVIGESYAQYAFQLNYSLDGGKTWMQYDKGLDDVAIIALTQEQIASINAEDDILLYISGEDVSDEDYFTIDIQETDAPVLGTSNGKNQIAIHDGENWIVGKNACLEFSKDGGATWTPYVHGETFFPGGQTILVRYAATGTNLASPSIELTFTAENESKNFQHISVSQVELVSASDGKYYSGQKGEYALDASPFTQWHSAAGASREIIARFAGAKSLAGLTYNSTPDGRNGRIKDLEVYVSMDGQDWHLAGGIQGWGDTGGVKVLTLEKTWPAQYVKLVATHTHTNGNEAADLYISGLDIDFYEDPTVEASSVSIVYSNIHPTNEDVTATLMLPEGYTAAEKVYTFTKNGTHEFAYTDDKGAAQTITAAVTWIDREAPTAAVSYSTEEKVDSETGVVVTLIPSESVTMTVIPQEAVVVTDETTGAVTYRFHDNGTFRFTFVDDAGNEGYATAVISCIIPDDSNHVSFSFSGDLPGELLLNSFYDHLAVTVTYSLDGGAATETVELSAEDLKVIRLTAQQLADLVALEDMEGEIVVTLTMGDGYTRQQTIDLLAGSAKPVIGSGNANTQINYHDGENWIVGKIAHLEYSCDNLNWTAYDHTTTRFPGYQKVYVRYAGDGLKRPSESISIVFTDTNERDDFRHISVSEVNLVRDNNTTYYQGRRGNLAIDANPFTSWHSDNNQTAENKVLVVSFDNVKAFAGFTYQTEGSNGRFRYVDTYVSHNGEDWLLVHESEEWAGGNTALKTVELENPVSAQYVKLQAETWNGYISARDIDFYEDTTVQVEDSKPVASVTIGGITTTGTIQDIVDMAAGSVETSAEITLVTDFDHADHSTLITEVIKAIAQRNSDKIILTLDASDGHVTFDAAAVKTIDGNAIADVPIVLHVDDVTGTDNHVTGAAATYKVTMTQEDKPVFAAGETTNGTATVTVPLPTELKHPVVYHVAGGVKTLLDSKVENGFIRFLTGHFSTFTIEEGHNYAATVTPPTFEADGYTTYTCSGCGDSYTVTDEGSKKIAVAQIGEGKYETLADAIEAANDGSTITVIADTIITAENAKAASTKNVSITKAADLAVAAPAGYEWKDGTTLVEKAEEPVVDNVIKFTTAYLLYKEEVKLLFEFKEQNGYNVTASQLGLQVWSAEDYAALSGQLNAESTPTTTYTDIVRNGSVWQAVTDGIPAKNMVDVIYVRAYAEIDGVKHFTKVVEYSPAIYARNRYQKTTDSDEKAAVIALVNYGTAAQTKLNYRANEPMNAFLTNEEKNLNYSADMIVPLEEVDAQKLIQEADGQNFTNFQAFGLFKGCLSILFSGDIEESIIADLNDIEKAAMLYWDAEAYEKHEKLSKDNCTQKAALVRNGSKVEGAIPVSSVKNWGDTGYYSIYIEDADRNGHYFKLVAYSAHRYAERMIEKKEDPQMVELAKAMVVYSCKAKTYLEKE